jgi:hypothetical protein
VIGMFVGSSLFAAFFPRIDSSILQMGYFGELTFPELLKMKRWVVVVIFALLIVAILYLLEHFGL